MDEPWARLEADLTLRAAGLETVEADARRAELLRAERAAVPLADRLRASTGNRMAMTVADRRLLGDLLDVGADHVRARNDAGEFWVAIAAVTRWEGVGPGHVPASRVAAGWTMAAVLRRLAADRAEVVIVGVDAGQVTGRVETVGRDHADVRPVTDDPDRRWSVLTLPLAGIALVRRT